MNMRVSLLLGAAGVMALGACATNPDGTTGTTLSKTQQGALIGAVAGGALAAGRDKDKNNQGKDFVKGAVLGAAAGAVVGNVLEAQEKQLRQVMTSPGVQIINRGDLYGLAQSLNQYPNSRVEIYGHTDSTASEAYNMDLSQRRAQSVGGILTAAGVSPARLVMVGRGESQPIASNNTDAGKAQNRRVEILIRPTN
ncbi:OmpA family protein [Paracoccus aurantiacus]|uniref:OmpA family protein n=1 Tax=Paracoccus aurantiacus TaxID=2599412 RepID=UPI0036332FAC